MFCAASLLTPCFGANLLKNSDFSDLTGAKLPRNWTIRGPLSAVSVENGVLTLGGDAAKGVMAIQYQLPVKPGVPCTMSFFAAGKAVYKCYIEYTYREEGKKKIKGLHYDQLQATEGGATEEFTFTIPQNAEQSYLGFSVKSAEKVALSKLSLLTAEEAKQAAGLLPNRDFSRLNSRRMPVGWKCPGKPENYRFSVNKAEVTGKNFLIGNLGAAIGKQGVFSCRVAGQGKYRIYVEWYWTAEGKMRSGSTRAVWTEATPEGREFTLPFNIPAYAKTAILAIRTDAAEGFLAFSDLRVKEGALKVTGPVPESFVLPAKGVQNVAIPKLIAGKKYKLTYQVRGSGATGNTTCFHFFKVQIVNPFNDLRGSFPSEDCMEVFQSKSVVFTAPANDRPDVLRFLSQSAGKLEFKGIRIVPFAGDLSTERLVVTSPRFRETFYSSLPESRVAGHVISAAPLADGEAVLKSESGKRFSASLKQEGKLWKFALPGEPGTLEVTFTAADGKKKLLTKRIRRLPAAPVEVVTGPGRRLYINGKPFIPVEIGRVGPSLREQASNGGTVVRRTAGNTPEKCLAILDRERKNGIGVILSFMNTVPRTADGDQLRRWEHRAENILTKEVLAHPALVGYFIDDEPYWNGVALPSLRKCYEVLRKLDPYRPVIICSAPRGSVEEQRSYADCCDIFGVDIYPVPSGNSHSHLEDKTPSCVGKYVRRMEEITDGVKPVAIWLQGFSWKDYKRSKPGSGGGYPTWQESRFMLFDAVLNGADAFFYYGAWLIREPGFYDDLMKVVREMHSLSGVLVSANDVPGKVSSDAVEYRCYRGKDWSCVIAANTRNGKVAAAFAGVPGVPAGEQSFEPYEVKIFTVGKLPPPLVPLPPAVPETMNYRKQIIARRDALPYTAPSGMMWIWGEKEKSLPDSRIFARKSFEVEPELKQAFLRVAADDLVAGIALDGKTVADAACLMHGTRYLNNLELGTLLKPGRHLLVIDAKDGGMLPCGLLAELRLEYANGKVVSIPTDASWETAPEAAGPWGKAAELKKIGDRPWGMPAMLKAQQPRLGR